MSFFFISHNDFAPHYWVIVMQYVNYLFSISCVRRLHRNNIAVITCHTSVINWDHSLITSYFNWKIIRINYKTFCFLEIKVTLTILIDTLIANFYLWKPYFCTALVQKGQCRTQTVSVFLQTEMYFNNRIKSSFLSKQFSKIISERSDVGDLVHLKLKQVVLS